MESYKLYRWWKGGKWYFYKLGRDTPSINLFSMWTQASPKHVDMNYCILLATEDYTKYPSWCCQKCGAPIGWIGRFILFGKFHECIPRKT